MKYLSTRGRAPVLEFGDVLLAGLASDGGLYVPEEWPAQEPLTFDASYPDTAASVMAPYVAPTLGAHELRAMVDEAYATFGHPDVCPVRPLDDGLWLLELFWGPTIAFKDVALQLVGRLFDHELARRGERATIVVATSGDTGSAAIEACRGRRALDIVVLHPAGRVSDVQRRQMTTVDEPNVHNVAVDGTFDDCQDLVKAMFADAAFRDGVSLSAMNSINWARVMAQVVYYVTAARTVGAGDPVAFSVPTGNFGNVFAGWVARRTGTPISQLVVGSNSNDILTRWLRSGVMEKTGVHPTISPSMDIQVSSNAERLLFELYDRNPDLLADRMAAFRDEGRVDTGSTRLASVTEVFDGAAFDDDATCAEIRRTFEATGVVLDPHSAVGVAAARAARRDPDVPMVCLATAHPAKFPDAVEQAIGVRPELPEHLADLLERPERFDELPADLATLQAYVRAAVGA
ncbi:MAG: threonine synthase [Acidimicrobiales bacterium]|mgnify:CR=1 FL=1|nr:threonine synthase [Acidimicrobiales bacterium]HRW36643.1 threonine synthase [Aquihabitans sp.]